MSDCDLVLRGARVIDPESGLDAVRDVAIGQRHIAARLLEENVPAMRRKGRLQAGRDADIVVFDPETITWAALSRAETAGRSRPGRKASNADKLY